MAATPGAKVITGDFNRDGKTDIALTGASGWDGIAVAFSRGNGFFDATVLPVSDWRFPAMAATPGAKVITGDFNHDGRTDIALTGASGWEAIAVALSIGDGGSTSFLPARLPSLSGCRSGGSGGRR